MRGRGGRYQVGAVCAAAVVVLALAVGLSTTSDAASPFADPYGYGGNGGPSPTIDRDGPRVPAKGATTTTRASRSGVFAFAFGPFREDVRGTAAFTTTRAFASKKRKLSLGTKKFSAKIGKKAKVKVKLAKRSRRVLRRYGKLRVQVKVVVKDFMGNATRKTYVFTLKRPR